MNISLTHNARTVHHQLYYVNSPKPNYDGFPMPKICHTLGVGYRQPL